MAIISQLKIEPKHIKKKLNHFTLTYMLTEENVTSNIQYGGAAVVGSNCNVDESGKRF